MQQPFEQPGTLAVGLPGVDIRGMSGGGQAKVEFAEIPEEVVELDVLSLLLKAVDDVVLVFDVNVAVEDDVGVPLSINDSPSCGNRQLVEGNRSLKPNIVPSQCK
jgi:hypothetical protein